MMTFAVGSRSSDDITDRLLCTPVPRGMVHDLHLHHARGVGAGPQTQAARCWWPLSEAANAGPLSSHGELARAQEEELRLPNPSANRP